MALCVMCAFAASWAATSVAAKAARVPHGRAAVVRRRRSLTNGDSRDKATCIHGCSLAPSSGYAAQRLRSANPFFRSSSLLSMPVRLALLGNGHGPCGAAVWSAPPCRITMRRGGGVAPYALTRVPPAAKESFNTILEQRLFCVGKGPRGSFLTPYALNTKKAPATISPNPIR